ncbi:MAG: response regulator transcription factor [Bacteroidales bacterium]|nr:response regulator transcription factor [Bacteroidales bacterium]MCF8403987.1 response regulator transcription factor [Bacteroidales bacterium]
MKILIVEDEPELLKTVSRFLTDQGLVCENAKTLFLAEDKILSSKYDIVILDIGLPDGNGLDLLKLIPLHQSDCGILIISAKDSLEDKISGLDMGADDYITKPFHLSELNSRVNSVIRRRKFKGSDTLIYNEIKIKTSLKEAEINGKTLELTKKEYELILFLMTNKNRLLTKEVIAEHLWGEEMEFSDSFDFIYTHIKNLRKKIISAGGQNYIQTMYGMGYKFSER